MIMITSTMTGGRQNHLLINYSFQYLMVVFLPTVVRLLYQLTLGNWNIFSETQ